MVIKRLVSIKNTGVYRNVNAPFENWDGCFKLINLLYGENGTGKTTLSIIFRSLSGDDSILNKKRSFNSDNNPEVLFLKNDGKHLKYLNGTWNEKLHKVYIFDIHFIEENLFVGYESLDRNKRRLFDIVIGKEGVELKKLIDQNLIMLQEQKRKVKDMRSAVKIINKSNLKMERADFDKQFDDEISKLSRLVQERRNLNIELRLSRNLLINKK